MDREEAMSEERVGRGSVKKGLLGPIGLIAIILFIVAMVAAGYFYVQWNEVKNNPEAVAQEEIEALKAKVGELIVLPVGEEPTVATVNDPEALVSQPFFANAKKGDKVLIYTTARKAILYDPIAHKIVEVAPVNIGEGQDQQ